MGDPMEKKKAEKYHGGAKRFCNGVETESNILASAVCRTVGSNSEQGEI